MMTVDDIRKPRNKSGFSQVGFINGDYPSRRKSSGPGHSYYQAYAGPGRRGDWKGPARDSAEEAAQDYCDYMNGNNVARGKPVLNSAGHNGKRDPLPRDPEVEAALGVLRDARGARDGNQGYVYLIIEVNPGGGLSYGKVGFSTNPQARVAELQIGNPRPLALHVMRKGTQDDEAALHAKYIANNVLQEWFHITKELLLEFDLDADGIPFSRRIHHHRSLA